MNLIFFGVEVEKSFSVSFTFQRRLLNIFKAFFSRDFRQDVWSHLPLSLHPGYLKRLFSFLTKAFLTRDWILEWLSTQKINPAETIFYTFWFDEIAMGVALAKEKLPLLRFVSRAHGYDLYEEIYGVWPCRSHAISLLDGLFPDSQIGVDYLTRKYPQYVEKYQVALLGVPDPGGVASPSTDGVLRVVSCSILIPVKRIDLLFAAIIAAGKMKPDQKIEWTHYGDGEDRQRYVERAAIEFPPNVRGNFPGYQTQRDLIKNYLTQPVDVFVNVSSTEGTPVAIMEAVSCGVPVIATAVGGNVEIVSEKNGFLLGENPTPNQIAEVLLQVCGQRENMLQKRQASRKVWLEKYNEITNFEAFAQTLSRIRMK
jgi:glycosyltransferase involved in cell wall biosynthesis